jgi:hypothetical protein
VKERSSALEPSFTTVLEALELAIVASEFPVISILAVSTGVASTALPLASVPEAKILKVIDQAV